MEALRTELEGLASMQAAGLMSAAGWGRTNVGVTLRATCRDASDAAMWSQPMMTAMYSMSHISSCAFEKSQ